MTPTPQPKKWKFALLVWCFIYPMITLISLFLLPQLQFLPGPLRTLSISLILVPLMVWFYIPFAHKRFHNWLRK